MEKVEAVEKSKKPPGKSENATVNTSLQEKKAQNLVSARRQRKSEEISRKAFGGQASVEERGSRQRVTKGDGCVRRVCSGQSGYPPSGESVVQMQRSERGSTWNAA